MFKVLIVDDEYYFRQALKVTLPWEESGFQIAGEAKNGEEALALLPEVEPDVVLVDINMPIMDGIEFIQNAKRREKETKFIILTGHSEFVYAKQAMQLGVNHYVLKPINEEDLQSALHDIKELILKERSERLQLENLKKQVKENLPVLKDRLLNEWLQGNGTLGATSAKERLEVLGIDLNSPYFAVVVIDIDSIEGVSSGEGKSNLALSIQDIAQEIIQNTFPYAYYYDHNDRLVMIVGSPDGSYDRIKALCEEIRLSVHQNMACTITVGIGSGYPGVDSISLSHKEALFALKHRFVSGGNQVIVHSMITESRMNVSLFSVEKRSSLLMCMRIGNLSETEEWLASFFQDVRTKNATMEMLLVAGLEILSTCIEFLAEASLTLEDVFQNEEQPDMLQYIQRMNTLSQLESGVSALILKVMTHTHGRKQNRAVKIIDEVKSYIRRHYIDEELGIEDIAKSVHMNYNHLCYVFKKETSLTINDYLTEFRIAKAKELFDQGEKIIQVVAIQVGYADANYFSKCFKKVIGITPSKYVNNSR
ncbi:response regulator [Cohnella lupini]|uniref:AraC family two component transcriptional regulator n=1 Tax=Cohnella lupini TaxID=1294267 RepID=A0A3D9IJB7_9BACL|nr:response regulator [Cohnella lupini]RED61873.1 AraC family two component transcriptional regulator [Cohnella lupini]